MSSSNQNQAKENLVKKIKYLCGKLLVDENDQESIKIIISLINKGVSYSFYVLNELLDFQAKNFDSLSTKLSNAIFGLIDLALFTNKTNGDQNVLLTAITHFISKNKKSETVGKIIKIFHENNEKGKNQLTLSKPEVMFELSEALFYYTPTQTERRIVPILVPFFKCAITNENSLLKVLQSLSRSARDLTMKKRFNDVADLLRLILDELPSELEPTAVTKELLDICIFVLKYLRSEPAIIKTSYELAKELSKRAKSKSEDQNGCIALELLFELCEQKEIDADLLNKLTSAFKKLDKKDCSHQKIVKVFTKVVSICYSMKLNPDEESFKAFHNLSVASYHILVAIKNEPGIYDCCSNVKRHEVANLIVTLVKYAMNIFKNIPLSNSSSHNIVYHLSYFVKVMTEIDCKTKDSEIKQMYTRVYNLLYDLSVDNKSKNVEHIRPLVEHLFIILLSSSQDSRVTFQDPFVLVLSIFGDPVSKDIALECASATASLYNYMSNCTKKYGPKELMKVALQVYLSAEMIGYSSGTDFINNSLEHKKMDFIKGSKIDINEFSQIEICSLTRYTNDNKAITRLFNTLCEKTDKPERLANCMYLLDDRNMEGINMAHYKKLLKDLEKIKEFKIEYILALAVGHYNIYSKIDSSLKKENGPKNFQSMNLKSELELLDHLIKAQNYFTDIIVHLKSDPTELKKIISIQRVTSIINNMAIQFYMRGVKLMEIETFTILWHFSLLDNPNPNKVLNAATFFIDNYQCLLDTSGNYVRFSKKLKPLSIEEIIVTGNKVVKDEIKDFRIASEEFQCIVLSYLISTWLFYFKKNRKADAMEQFKILKDLWKISTKPHTSDSRNAVLSKLYFSLVDANLVKFNRSANNFMSKSNGFLLNAKNIPNEFCHQFYQIFYRVTISNINYSLNRHNDLDHYETTIQSMISMAQKKNYCLKILELLSLSILRNLNMEKIEIAQNQLKNISLVLGLNEDVLIESPLKLKNEEPTFIVGNYANETEGMRKAALTIDSPTNLEYSIRHVDRADLLSLQLKTFVHEETCKCETCQYPQLKFYSFQVGCFYSRLMFLMKKLDVSVNFHKFAIEPWRTVCDKLRRIKEFDNFLMINKSEFHVFSIRWLFQFADTLILMKDFEVVGEVYQEIDLLLTNNIHDSECFKQTLFCRKENLNFLIENYKSFETPEPKKDLSFGEFFKLKNKSSGSSSKTASNTAPKTVKIKAASVDAVKTSSKTPAGHVKVKKLDTKSTAKPSTKKTTSPMYPIYVDDSDEEPPTSQNPPSLAGKPPATTASSSIPKGTSVATSSSRPTSSSTTVPSATVKSSRTKISDQTPKNKKPAKDEKEDKTEAARKNLRRRMI